MKNSGEPPLERDKKSMDKEPFEQVPTTRAGDRVLRRRRKSRSIIPLIFRNIRKLVRGTDSK
jgi:hypothetical protein